VELYIAFNQPERGETVLFAFIRYGRHPTRRISSTSPQQSIAVHSSLVSKGTLPRRVKLELERWMSPENEALSRLIEMIDYWEREMGKEIPCDLLFGALSA